MEAIILAGGLGTRLRSAVPDLPKPMAPVGGRPFLELLLRSLAKRGVTRAILSIGYRADSIVSFFSVHDVGMELVYEIEKEPLGTGGAMAAALRHLESDHAFVFNGDTYMDLPLDDVGALWPGDRSTIVVTRPVPDTARFGRVEVADGRISRFVGSGTPGPGLINAGTYVVPAGLFAAGFPRAFSFEADYLQRLPGHSLRAFPCNGHFIDIGVPADYLRAQTELAALCDL